MASQSKKMKFSDNADPDIQPQASTNLAKKTCRKQDKHRNYKLFKDLSKHQLKASHQQDKVVDIINRIGRRVVAIRAIVRNNKGTPTITPHNGSGILFKNGNNVCVQTTDHATLGTQEVEVKYMYHDDDSVAEENGQQQNERCSTLTVLEGKAIGRCFEQDKAVYQIQNFSKNIDADNELPNVLNLEVEIQPKQNPGLPPSKGQIQYYNDTYKNSFSVHFNENLKGIDPEEYEIVFTGLKKTTNCIYKIPCEDIQTCSMKSGCSKMILKASNIPGDIQTLLHKQLPWVELDRPSLTVMVSHPHGKLKQISFGEVEAYKPANKVTPRDGKRSHDGDVFVCHTALTCPGSSGGCAILINGSTENNIEFQSYACMHHGVTNIHATASVGVVNS